MGVTARRTIWLALGCLALAGPVPAQERADASYFPLELGRSWTYHLTLHRSAAAPAEGAAPDAAADAEERHIEYTTTVARKEVLDGRECAVLEARSDQRLLQVSWFVLQDERVLQTQVRNGDDGRLHAFQGRVAFDPAVLEAPGSEAPDSEVAAPGTTAPEATTDGQPGPPGPDEAPGPRWTWRAPDGSEGVVTFEGRDTVRVRGLDVECLRFLDRGTYLAGERRATQVRHFWLARGIGLVRERSVITIDERVIESDAVLLRHEAP